MPLFKRRGEYPQPPAQPEPEPAPAPPPAPLNPEEQAVVDAQISVAHLEHLVASTQAQLCELVPRLATLKQQDAAAEEEENALLDSGGESARQPLEEISFSRKVNRRAIDKQELVVSELKNQLITQQRNLVAGRDRLDAAKQDCETAQMKTQTRKHLENYRAHSRGLSLELGSACLLLTKLRSRGVDCSELLDLVQLPTGLRWTLEHEGYVRPVGIGRLWNIELCPLVQPERKDR